MLTDVALCAQPGCANPVEDGAVICRSSLADFRHLLRHDIPEVLGELLITTTRQDVSPRPPGPGGSDEPPLVYRPEASDAGRDLHAALLHVVEQVLAARGLTIADITPGGRPDIHRPDELSWPGIATYGREGGIDTTTGRFPDNNTLELALWLDRHPDTVQEHPRAGVMVDEITDAVARCWYAVDRPDTSRQFLGLCECTVDSNAAAWSRELWAREDSDVVQCRACGSLHNVATRRERMLKKAENLYVTAEAASRALPVMINSGVELTPEVIRGWVRHHGLVYYEPHPDDPHQRFRYRLGDLIDHIGKARQRAADRAAARVAPLLDELPDEIAAVFEQARRAAAEQNP